MKHAFKLYPKLELSEVQRWELDQQLNDDLVDRGLEHGTITSKALVVRLDVEVTEEE